MIKKIKDYFSNFIYKFNNTYVPLKRAVICYFIIIFVMLFAGVCIGRLTCLSSDSDNTICLSSDSDIIIEDKEYFLIPMLPYTNNNNYFDFSQGNFIISYNSQHTGYLDIVYPTTANGNLIYEQTLVGTNYYLDIAMQSQNIGYYSEMYLKRFRIVLSYDNSDWLYNFDRISRYGYFYDIGTGLNYNTVYNFYQNDSIIAKLYFMDNETIPYFDYTNVTNLVFTTEKVSSFNLDNLLDTSYNNGYINGRADGLEVGYQQGYNQGSSDGYDLGYDIGYDGGYDDGYNYGYNSGFNDGETTQLTFWTVIKNSFNSFMGINILPNLTIGTIMLIPIGLLMFNLLIKLFKF